MNMKTELLANVIFLMLLLACIACASFGVASCLSPGDVSEVSKLKRDIYYLHRKMDAVTERINFEYLESRDKHFASRLAEHDREIMKLCGNIGCLNKIVTMTPEDVQKTLDNHEKRIKELEMWVPRPVPCEIFTIETNGMCAVSTNHMAEGMICR